MNGSAKKERKKPSGLRLLLRTLKHVIRGDEDYIRKALYPEEDPDRIELVHNGTTDYGKVIYVIRENSGQDGFCATVRFVLCHLLFAGQLGFVPKIRLTEGFAYFDEDMRDVTDNPWEYYFLPVGENYDEREAMNVCLSRYYYMQRIKDRYGLNAYRAENYDDERIFRICSPMIREYLVLRPQITEEAEELLRPIREGGGKILGVHYRGTDFKRGYDRHPVYVGAEQMMAEVGKALAAGSFTAIFLATDDASFGERMPAYLGEIPLLMYPEVYRSDGDESVAFSRSSRKYHHYLLGYEIARDMYTLSLCDGLTAGKSSVSFLSNLYKHSREEAYGYLRIIDNGNNENGR